MYIFSKGSLNCEVVNDFSYYIGENQSMYFLNLYCIGPPEPS